MAKTTAPTHTNIKFRFFTLDQSFASEITDDASSVGLPPNAVFVTEHLDNRVNFRCQLIYLFGICRKECLAILRSQIITNSLCRAQARCVYGSEMQTHGGAVAAGVL